MFGDQRSLAATSRYWKATEKLLTAAGLPRHYMTMTYLPVTRVILRKKRPDVPLLTCLLVSVMHVMSIC